MWSIKEHQEKDYNKALVVEKTEEEMNFIKRSLEKNPYFSCLDSRQVENFVEVICRIHL